MLYLGRLLPRRYMAPSAARRLLLRDHYPLMRQLFGEPPVFEIDHFVPRRWGGVDHPENYVATRPAVNRAFGCWITPEKARLLGREDVATVAKRARSPVPVEDGPV